MWHDVFLEEMDRRRRLRKKAPDIYLKMAKANPKGLLSANDCGHHIWVPATHVWLHDAKAKKVIDNVRRRSFEEALPYRDHDCMIIPQVCWECDAVRDREIRIRSTEEVQAELKAQRPEKPRKTKYIIEDQFDDLFADLSL